MPISPSIQAFTTSDRLRVDLVVEEVTALADLDVFVETNQPLPRMGIKQWSTRLTPHPA